MIKTQTTVSFADIFHWAGESPRNVRWNHCCDIFHCTELLKYRGQTEIYRDEWAEELNDPKFWEDRPNLNADYREAYTLIVAFMDEHKLDHMLVLGD